MIEGEIQHVITAFRSSQWSELLEQIALHCESSVASRRDQVDGHEYPFGAIMDALRTWEK
jgi:hypothetical protein